MKPVLVSIAMASCLITNAYGEKSNIQISLSAESMKNGSAATIGIYTGVDVFYGGLSFSHIESSNVIQYNNRKTIHPVYFYAGLKAPWKFNPYIEAGVDLPEAIIDDLLDNEEKSEAQAGYNTIIDTQ